MAPDPSDARVVSAPHRWSWWELTRHSACVPGATPRPSRSAARRRRRESWAYAEGLGAAYVALLPAAEPWLVERLADRFDNARRRKW